MIIIDCFSFDLNRVLTRSLIAGFLAAMSILGGVTPEFSWQSPGIIFSYLARTQEFNDEQITKYARAVLEIESGRQQAYQKIRQIIGQSPPEIVCNQTDSLRNLPREAQTIAVDYCTSSKRIVEKSGLSVAEFNAITMRVRSERELERRIQNAMIRIRQQQ
jgi:hypothetical protein